MSNYLGLYLLTRLDSFKDVLTGFTVVSFIYIIAVIVFCIISRDFDEFYTDDETIKRNNIRNKFSSKIMLVSIIGCISLLITTTVPNKEEALFIAAGGKTIDYIQSDTSLQKIPFQATSIVSSYMEKELNGIKSSIIKE